MADVFTVHFTVAKEPTYARFEFKSSAMELAGVLEDAGFEPLVADMNRETVYDGREGGE